VHEADGRIGLQLASVLGLFVSLTRKKNETFVDYLLPTEPTELYYNKAV